MNRRTVNNQFQICERCETKTRNWNIHHKNCDHFDNRKENLQWVCVPCHAEIHQEISKHLGRHPLRDTRPEIHIGQPHREGLRIEAGYKLMESNDFAEEHARDYEY